jgi:hypothetical protein
VVFTEMGPATIVDGNGKIVGNGAVVDVAVQPGNARVLFAASAGGGVWRATDAASMVPAWEPRTDALPSTAMGAVAIAPGDSTGRTVLAGTGSFSSWGPTGPAVGMYKSTDGGDTWRVTAHALRGRLIRTVLPLAPPNGSVVLVAARTDSAGGGIFRSTDGGETFGPIRGTTPRGRLPAGDGYALVEDPGSTGQAVLRGRRQQSRDLPQRQRRAGLEARHGRHHRHRPDRPGLDPARGRPARPQVHRQHPVRRHRRV